MTHDPACSTGLVERCLAALTAEADRTEMQAIVAVGDYRRDVLADDTVLVFPSDERADLDRPEPGLIAEDGGRALTLGAWAEQSAVMLPFGRVLHRLARAVSGPIVELGTGAGVSAAYLASGREDGGAQLTTIEPHPVLADRARTHLASAGYGGIQVVTGQQEIDGRAFIHEQEPTLVHVDSDHRYASTWELLHTIAAHRPVVICLDDIRWSPGMERVWHQIEAGELGCAATIDLGLWGVAIVDDTPRPHPRTVTADPPRANAGIAIAGVERPARAR